MSLPAPHTTRTGFYALGSTYPYITGGMEVFNYYFIRHRLSQGHQGDYYWTINELPGWEANHLRLKYRHPIRFFYPWQLFWKLFRYRSRIDYIYVGYGRQSWVLPYFYARIFRFFKKPYVVTIHSGNEAPWKSPGKSRYFFQHAAALVGVSQQVCADYRQRVPGKTLTYIPPLIPFTRSTKTKAQLKEAIGLADSDKVILYIGSMKRMKNPDKIMEAFLGLGESFIKTHRLHLVMAGTGELHSPMQAQKQEAPLGSHVQLPGLLDREKVPELFGMADYYIIASDYEGTSVSLLEAMFNALPIAGADAPGINDMIRNEQNGLLFAVNDTEKIKQALTRLVEDASLANRLGQQAVTDFEQQYSYASMMDKYDLIFNNLN